jgi:hypothetical protein
MERAGTVQGMCKGRPQAVLTLLYKGSVSSRFFTAPRTHSSDPRASSSFSRYPDCHPAAFLRLCYSYTPIRQAFPGSNLELNDVRPGK